MNAKTDSEQLFEDFCAAAGVGCDRVPVSDSGGQRPDYKLDWSHAPVVAEVKEFAPNREERRAAQQLRERGWSDVIGGEPGDRVRKAITDARPQLAVLSAGRCPALLVVFNNTRVTFKHVDPYAIRTGMFGMETFEFDQNGPAVQVATDARVRQGPKQKLTPVHNTTISAVAVLYDVADSTPHLWIYHNHHSARRLPESWCRSARCRHFELERESGLRYPQWRELAD